MKQVDPNIYSEDFYTNCCLGSSEFTESNGKKLHPNVFKILERIPSIENKVILDIGCGRGDITLHLAKKCKRIWGIDYAAAGIKIANNIKKNFSPSVQKRTMFSVMDAKKLEFPDNYFDLIVCIDIFEHLYKEELILAMREIRRVLKKDGILFVHTVTNKILYDVTYPYYIYPMNHLLTGIDKTIKRKNYNSFPKQPRVKEELDQHVNEPTYFYLKKLFSEFSFTGKILIDIGYIKEKNSIKTRIYNFLLTLYPLSKIFPLSLLFGWAFTCIMVNKK